MSALSVDATPARTIKWIASAPAIAVPVYQREYRWSINTCSQLLDDILAVARKPEASSYFIGSVLATPDASNGLTLVDGQQRLTTILVLVAALHDVAQEADPELAAELMGLLTAPGTHDRPRLRTHERHAATLNEVLLGDRNVDGGGAIEGNFSYFRDQISDAWRDVWTGLNRLEHVAITLMPDANPQQVFESLNSTGEPLSDDELIHNYIHMGRQLEEQIQIEREVWNPIEDSAGHDIRQFWRDYLVLTSATPPELRGDRGVYHAFCAAYPDLSLEQVQAVGPEWVRLAEVYGLLLAPAKIEDTGIARRVRALGTFGSAAYPLALGVLDEWRQGKLDRSDLLDVFEKVETLYLRRALNSQAVDIGPICREYALDGVAALLEGVVRRTPEDPSMTLALSHRSLPYAPHVLSRLQGVEDLPDLQVEHIYPQAPADDWTGGGAVWGSLSTEERAQYRALLSTIGNLTMLEAPLNQGAGRRNFSAKKPYYERSKVRGTQTLADAERWDDGAIRARTAELIEQFLTTWPRPGDVPVEDDEDLIKVVDLPLEARRGFLQDEFEYAVLDGLQYGEVTDVKKLFVAVFSWLWTTRPEDLRMTTYGGWVVSERTPNKRFADLGDGYYLYAGWASQYILDATQTVLRELELEGQVSVRFSSPPQ